MTKYILAIDQGTTSSRAIVFGQDQSIAAVGQKEFTQHFPRSGWVEHDPEEIWETVEWSVAQALDKAGLSAADMAAIGITNQRETVVVWDRGTGEAVFNAIVWLGPTDGTELCTRAQVADGLEPGMFAETTGLVCSIAYFSGTKIALDPRQCRRCPGATGPSAASSASAPLTAFLLFRLTGGKRACHRRVECRRARMVFDIAYNRSGTMTLLDRLAHTRLR